MGTRIAKVIAGGQTGADQGALRAARAAGIPTADWAPRRWLTEVGPAPWLADFGLKELDDADYAARTRRNVSEAAGLVWFGNPWSPGGRCTMRACVDHNIDTFTVMDRSTPREVARWIRDYLLAGEDAPVVLMVAGNRESKRPGIGAKAEAFMGEVFSLLAKGDSA